MLQLDSAHQTVELVAKLSVVAPLLQALELLVALDPFAVRVVPSDNDRLPDSSVLFRRCLLVQAIAVVQLICGGVTLAASPSSPAWLGAYAATAVAFLAIGWLTPLIQGADYQLALITFVAAGASLAIRTELASLACLYFLCAQLAMAYFAAGYHKMSSRAWRSGTGLTGILSTTLFGHPYCAGVLSSRPFVAKAASWSVMIWELTFPVALILPGWLICIYLVLGVLFHVSVASSMGLNKFLWAFVSLYPALVFTTRWH